MQYPNELTPALMDALGIMNFQSGPIAHIYRDYGHDIPRKCEAEQAFVLHRYIRLALKHGEGWRSHAQDELVRMRAQIAASAQAEAMKPTETCRHCGSPTELDELLGLSTCTNLLCLSSFQGEAAAPTAQGQDPLGKVRQAIADYHYALDTRRHAGAWAEITLETIRDALDMPWVQGAELARRSSAPSTSAGEAK